jgi:hypothetical protein
VIGEIETPPFWKTTTTLSPTSNLTPEQQRELALLRKERDLRMKDLIAGSVEAGAAESIAARQRWGPVPAEKVAAVHRIEADYAELRREIVANRSPLNLPAAEMEKLALLNRERRADIERTLTPDELFEYDLRQSPTASQLRSQLSSFRPTEDEFRAIFRVQHALDTASGRFAAYAGSMTISSSDRDETREAQLTHLKSILPPERYADFEFATNSANSSLARVANRFRVPLSSAREVATIRDATLKEIAKVREDSSNPPAVRDARTAELTLAAAERVSGALGPDAYRAYLENGGSWLTPRLPAAQRPAPSAP